MFDNLFSMLQSFGLGILIGAIFTLLKLPVPAPMSIEGVLGVFGLFLGFCLVSFFSK